jgi:ribonucleoside-diphosphate reductase alpha chain
MSDIYEELSKERKNLQEQGKLPDWVTTISWQMLKEKYLRPEWPDLLSTYIRISTHASTYTDNPSYWQPKFFDVMWNGWLSLSTPVLANMGTGTNCPVSCSGGVIGDSVYDFYDMQVETALLSKNGFGTSAYLGDIRPRGAPINGLKGGASGVLPVFKDYIQLSKDISQGNSRKGAWAGYIEIDHPDFYELVQYIKKFPDDANIGWIITNKFIDRLDNADSDAIDRYQEALLLKMLTGKGYFLFIDRVNDVNPKMYKDKGYSVKASNLCVSGDTVVEIRYDDIELKVMIKEIGNILKNYDNIEVKSFNENTQQVEWKPITDFNLTKKKARVLKIIDEKSGRYIKCTPCHLIYTTNRGYVRADQLNELDTLNII